MYYGYYLSKINRRKTNKGSRRDDPDDTMIELKDSEPAVSFKYYERLDARAISKKLE